MQKLQPSAAVVSDSLSSCWCCYLESRSSFHCSLHGPPLLPCAGRPSPPGSRRSALSASSCGSWCSASSSSSSAGWWRWPCGSSVWFHAPASVACSSCVGPGCGVRGWSRSPCGRADASVRSGVRGCPGPCGGAAPGSPGRDRGWARRGSSSCGNTAPRGRRSLHNHGSHSYTVRESRHRETQRNNVVIKSRIHIHLHLACSGGKILISWLYYSSRGRGEIISGQF